jgi:MOSC domain-containing protein YiiM
MNRRQRSYAELVAALPEIEGAPRERGTLDLIVRRPAKGLREVLAAGRLDVEEGLVGDRWALGKRRRVQQLTLINSRLVALLAQSREQWPLAGDQLYVDFDLSSEHLPAGTRVAVGAAEIEVSPEPHTGCRLFAERYGRDARRFVGSERGLALQLRGINAWVVKSGDVRVGDELRTLFD